MSGKLKDIAKTLDVSVSTVSRALNDKGRISQKMRKRILSVASEMNYHPDENARSLKTNKTSILGVIVPDITNTFYAKLVKGIEKSCKRNKYSVLLCNSDEDPKVEKEYYQLLKSKKVLGMIVVSVSNQDYYSKGNFENIIFVDNIPLVSKQFICITIDNVNAAYDLAEYVYLKGYRRIAVITGPAQEMSSKLRLEGIKKYLSANGNESYSLKVYEGDFKFEGGYKCMKQIIADKLEIDVVIALNNFLAYGAMAAMNENSINVPEQIKLVCFDAVDDMNIIKPKLTCIMQPVEEFGELAVKLLKSQLEKESLTSGKIFLNYTFVQGESC